MVKYDEFPVLVRPDSIISIPLTRGKRAYFNARHWPLIKLYTWHTAPRSHGRTYCALTEMRVNGKRTSLLMHRLVLGLNSGDPQVDHIDHDGLNNLDYNLRLATQRQNASNLQDKHLLTSKYTGVCWDSTWGRWLAQIRVENRNTYLGRFDSEIDARDAYLAALADLGEKEL